MLGELIVRPVKNRLNSDPPTSPVFFSSSTGELSDFNQSDARFVELDEQFPEHVERSVLDPAHSFVAVHGTARTRFAK